MLDQLIESKNTQRENKKRGRYLFSTGMLMVSLCFSAVLYSLFAKDFSVAADDLELSLLVAPIADAAPSELIKKPERNTVAEKTKSELPTRQANVLRIEESPINAPDSVSIVPNTQKARPKGQFLVADKMETDGAPNANFGKLNDGNTTGGIDFSDQGENSDSKPTKAVEPPPLPPVKKPVVENTKKPEPTIKSGGVVNGKAQFLPKPTYTAAAKTLRLNGEVNVQVLIDESGKVVSAKAISGHPLLKNEAEIAARNAKFNPTLLSDKPIKVSGIIIYKFSMQ